jgi:pSer/pThr/pTyr-binding forkhead associated (FHA) protein
MGFSADLTDNNNDQEASLPEKAFLVVNGMVFPLDKPVVKIGRNLENDLVLNHPTVSRFHAEIRYEERQFILVDMNSSSGTFLNNKKISRFQLFAGDIILFAKVPVMFMNEGASLIDTSDRRTGRLSGMSVLELHSDTEEPDTNPQST